MHKVLRYNDFLSPDFNWISFHDFSEEDEDSANNISSTLSFAWHPVEESIIMAIGRNGRLAECHVPGKHGLTYNLILNIKGADYKCGMVKAQFGLFHFKMRKN